MYILHKRTRREKDRLVLFVRKKNKTVGRWRVAIFLTKKRQKMREKELYLPKTVCFIMTSSKLQRMLEFTSISTNTLRGTSEAVLGERGSNPQRYSQDKI